MLLHPGCFIGSGNIGAGEIASYILTGTRNRPNTNTSTTTSLMRHHYQYRKDAVNLVNPTVEFDLSYLQSNGALTSTSITPVYLTAAIQYPIGGTLYPLLNGGTFRNQLTPGDTVALQATVTIPAGNAYRILYDLEFIGGGTHTFATGTYTSGSKDYVGSGTSASSLLADGTRTIPSPSTFTTFMFAPSAVYGEGSTSRVIAFLGDSILKGDGDTDQTDYDVDDNSLPFLNIGNSGLGEKGVGNLYPLINLSSSGRAASTVTEANFSALFDKAKGVTDFIVMLGTNDISLGANAATTVTRLAAVATLIKAQFPSASLYFCTIPPRATSTDSYVTKANQTPAATAAIRSSVNDSIRGGISGADGYIEIARVLEDPTDEDYWLSEGGVAYTSDGIHPNRRGHDMAAQKIYDHLVGEENKVTNSWFADDINYWTDKSQGTGSISWSTAGALQLNGTDSSNRAYAQQALTVTNGATYTITADFDGLGTAAYIRVGTDPSVLAGANYDRLNQIVSADGTATASFTANTTTVYLTFHSLANTSSFTIDNVRVVLS